MCQVTMKALDADGNAVVSHVTYFGEGNFMDAAVLAKARPYPRILHAVFVDTYERVKAPVTGDSPRTAPKLVANLDNSGRTTPAT